MLAAAVISHTPAVVIADIAVVVVVARAMGALAHRLGQPAVVGEIVGGILLGPSLLGALPGHLQTKLFPGDSVPHLQVLAQIGVVLFMFVIGLEVDPGLIRRRLVLAGTVSVSSVVIPFGLGIVLATAVLHRRFGSVSGHHVRAVPFALFIGVSLSITAFPVLARILTDRQMQHTPLGAMTLASAAMDDLIAWTLLALVVGVQEATGSLGLPVLLVEAAALVGFLILLVRPVLDRALTHMGRGGDSSPMVLAVLLVGVMATAAAADAIGVSVISGAFAFGAILPRKGHELLIAQVVEKVESLVVVLLLPLFFVVTGLTVNVRTLGWSGLGYLALVLLAAVGGKFCGAAIGARARGLTNRQAAAVGTLMNTRGLTELVILNVGHQLGVLGTELFSILVVMAIVTTVMTGPLLRLVYPDRLIRADLAEAEREMSAGAAGYRILVVCDPLPTPAVTEMAAALAGRGGVVFLAAYVAPTGSAAPGSSSIGLDLNLVASVMEDLRRIGPAPDGVSLRHLVRVSADPGGEALTQITDDGVDAVMTSADSRLTRALLDRAPCHVVVHPPGGWEIGDRVGVLVGEGNDDDTALELGLRLAVGRPRPTRVELTPVHPRDRARARRLADRANSLSPLHGAVAVTETLPEGTVALAGVASAATAVDQRAGLVAVRSGDDPSRVNLDQRFERVRVAAGQAADLAGVAELAASPPAGADG